MSNPNSGNTTTTQKTDSKVGTTDTKSASSANVLDIDSILTAGAKVSGKKDVYSQYYTTRPFDLSAEQVKTLVTEAKAKNHDRPGIIKIMLLMKYKPGDIKTALEPHFPEIVSQHCHSARGQMRKDIIAGTIQWIEPFKG